MVRNAHPLYFHLLLVAGFSNREQTSKSDVSPLKGTDAHSSVITPATQNEPRPTPYNDVSIFPIPPACPEVQQIKANQPQPCSGTV